MGEDQPLVGDVARYFCTQSSLSLQADGFFHGAVERM
jgi:hypothetical protein